MTGNSTVIRGGDVIADSGRRRADVLIEGEHIALVGEVPAEIEADLVVDAAGCYVIPGGVDVHTHLDMELGVTRSADDFFSGTRAAACGGTTTVVDFATAYRGQTAAGALARWHAKAGGNSFIDYAFHLTVCDLPVDAGDLVHETAAAGVTSFKLYMTYPERLMVPDEVIERVMQAAAQTGTLVCLHCEDDSVVSARRDWALSEGHRAARWHAWSRPPEAESAAVERAVRMAESTGAALYVVHLSSGDALERVRLARARALPVYAETCPQYLYLSDEHYEGRDAARFVCAPPLRGGKHREELWEGLEQGHIQVVSTDHCPFGSTAKNAGVNGGGWEDFTQIPGGLPGIETRVALVYQRVAGGDMTVEQWVDVVATAPARLFGLAPAKGAIAPGADADVVVFDPLLERQLVPERLHMNVDYSPYEDITVTGWPAWVLARGRVVARGGEPVGALPRGRFVARGPSGGPGG